LKRAFAKHFKTAVVVALVSCRAAGAYPIAEERKLGEQFSVEAASALPLVREPAVVEYVNGLGRKIVAKLDAPQPFDYRYSVIRDGTLNAFAAPGGFIYANSGLVLRVKNDAELAGVLAHETGHVHAHHIARQQEKTKLLSYASIAALLLGVVQPAIGAAAMGASAAGQLKYAREFEQEADFLGVRYMRAAGYDPHGMVSFMKEMWNEQRQMPLDQIPPYMMSHPMTEERLVNLEAATKDMKPTPGWDAPSFDLLRAQAVLRAIGGIRAAAPPVKIDGPQATALSGVALLYQGDAAGAVPYFEKARAAGFADTDSDLGLALFRTGNLDQALRVLRGRVEAAPEDAVAGAVLGKVLLAKGAYAEAARELERVQATAPELDEVAYDLGQAYGRSGDRGKGFYHLAQAMELRGDVDQAISQYDKANKLLPAGSDEGTRAKEKADRLREFNSKRRLTP